MTIYCRIIRKGQIFGLIRTSASHLHTMLVACPSQQHVGGDFPSLRLLNIPSPVNCNVYIFLNIMFI